MKIRKFLYSTPSRPIPAEARDRLAARRRWRFRQEGPIWRTRGWPKQSAAQFAGPWPPRQQGWRARSTSSGAKIASFFCILPKTIHLFFLYQTNTGFEWHTHTDRHRSYCMERVRSDLIVRSVELSRPGRKTKACQGASVFVSQAAGTVA